MSKRTRKGPGNPAKRPGRTTREERAARAAQMRAEQQAAERRRRQLWVTAGVVATILVVVLGYVIWSQTRSSTGDDVAAPANSTADHGFEVSTDPAADAPRVVAYEDFICPVCGAFEQEAGEWLREQADSGAIILELRPISILDRSSSTDYSTRAANAAACTADSAGPGALLQLHTELFAQQPAEGSAGLDDDTLVDLAVQAGADEQEVSGCITDGTYTDWVAQATDQASDDDVSSTPTVLVDGEVVTPGQLPTLADLQQAVADAG